MTNKADQSELVPSMFIFQQVVLAGSFSAAARHLNLSPSAVSRRIDKLEKLLGVTLLTRSTRNLYVTESGQDVFNAASEIALTTDSLLSRIEASMLEPEGFLRVTAPTTIGKILLSTTVSEFLKKYPKIKIEFNFTDNIIDIFKEKYELSVRVTNQPPGNMVARKFFDVNYCLVASVGFLDFNIPLHPRDLLITPIISSSDSFFWKKFIFINDSHSCSIDISPRLIINNSESLLSSVCEGIGVAVLPNFLAFPALKDGMVRRILPDWKMHNASPNSVYLLSQPSNKISAKARAYIDYLKEYNFNRWFSEE